MHAFELRRAFLDFFTARGHTAVPSAGLIPHHPSAPMFTNSGMMAPASVPQVMIVASFHHSVPSPMSGMSQQLVRVRA